MGFWYALVVITAIGCVTGLIFGILDQVGKLAINREKVKADAMIRMEEIRARNQLELEKLMMDRRTGQQQEQQPGQSPERQANPQDWNAFAGQPGSGGRIGMDAGTADDDGRAAKEKINS